MKTEIKIPVRAYPVVMKDTRTGEVMNDTIVLEKSRLQANVIKLMTLLNSEPQ